MEGLYKIVQHKGMRNKEIETNKAFEKKINSSRYYYRLTEEYSAFQLYDSMEFFLRIIVTKNQLPIYILDDATLKLPSISAAKKQMLLDSLNKSCIAINAN